MRMASPLKDALFAVASHTLLPRGTRGRVSILIYHRVLPHPDPIRDGEIDAATFDAQMAILAQRFAPLPLTEAVARLRAGTRLPERAVCVTFDDGYADNVSVALPLLKRHGIPATFFVASGYLDGGRMWNDTVIEAIARSPRTSLDLAGLGLGVLSLANAQERKAAINALLPALKHLPWEERESHANAIAQAGGASLPDDLMLRSGDLLALASAGMDIGGHTCSHPILRNLPPVRAEREIARDRDRLAQIVGRPVTLFAYPNGKPGNDYLPEHVAMAKALGFVAAVSTVRGAADRTSDPYQLPRFTPWDRSPRRFALRLLDNFRRTPDSRT
ncbi:MAG: polysaccharide deacetylase family protein [Betaproteobacteria bacterium]|nr:polysaccharide deacetylase family protein [Betaproteobacteria bacterium]